MCFGYRYKHQVLYGCQDPNCRTSTCASYRRRVSEGPFRRYTELSARTLACYLASLDNAESGLCRNTPRSSGEFTALDTPRRQGRRSRGSHAHTTEEQANRSGSTRNQRASQDDPAGPGLEEGCEVQKRGVFTDDEPPARQEMKDPKSFTQNLFDTLSLKMVEWLPIRRPPSAFEQNPDLMAQNTSSPKQEQRGNSRLEKEESYSSRRLSSSSSRTRRTYSNEHRGQPTRNPSGQATAVEVKLPNQQVKRLSLTEIEPWCQSPRSSLDEKVSSELKPARKLSINAHANISTPPAIKQRPPKNRDRTGGKDAHGHQAQKKADRRVSWDGSKLLNDVESSVKESPMTLPTDPLPTDIQSPSDRKLRRRTSRCRKEAVSAVQAVTHLTNDIVDGLEQIMIETEEESDRWKEELEYMELAGRFDDSEWRFATPRQRQAFAFVSQTVFYSLGSPTQILKCFRAAAEDQGDDESHESSSHGRLRLESPHVVPSLRKLLTICPLDIVLHSLWGSMEKLFVPPKELSTSARQSRRSSTNSSTGAPVTAPIVMRRTSENIQDEHVADKNAAHIATVALFALAGAVPEVDSSTWRGILRMRAIGTVAADADLRKLSPSSVDLYAKVTDRLEHELALRLANRLVRALTARLAFHEISKAREAYAYESSKTHRSSVLDLVVDNLSEQYMISSESSKYNAASTFQSPGAPAIIAEWLRTLLLKEWDGNPEVPRSSAVGGAVQILSVLYKERERLGLVPEDFHTPFLAERLDPLEMPVAWLGRSISNNKTMHLLSYSFLFPPPALVIYFRALNFSVMSKYYESAMTTTRHVTQTALHQIQILDEVALLARMKTSMSTYLVLVVRRDNIVTDSLNQLWRREKRELMRPLKVQMGTDEGEEGLDHGGVQQEFFRVLMAEMLDPAYGMFTMDPRTRVSWMQSCSWEPLYKFELIGLLMSIAVYNGLTLPVTFPIAFYRKLLGLKVKHLDHIRDGWPDLTKGLEGLLSWEDGDVSDIFMRTYEFSFEAFGRVETVDMQRVDRDAVWPLPPRSMPTMAEGFSTAWSDVPHYGGRANPSPPSSMAAEPTDAVSCASTSDGTVKSGDGSISMQSPTPPAEEASLVTNDNRDQFVRDYIFWLTDKSIRPQYEAFARGFYTCLDRTALSVFTPEALKTVVEGIQEIDIKELERHARYEGGFGPGHPVVRDFWSIVHSFSAEKKAHLLEFVTASDRVPVNGIASIMFVIQKNGVGDAVSSFFPLCFLSSQSPSVQLFPVHLLISSSVSRPV